ncbi:MAG: nucleoside-diphosphate kinase [Anaerolineaceae bacterium]
MEQTLVLIKPDGVQRNLVGTIINRLESRGLQLVAAKFLLVNEQLAREHYKAHVGKTFYEGLIKYIKSAPVMAMVWQGPHAVKAVRQTMGATNPLEADPGSIRHDFSIMMSRNLTHASDSLESASREIALWFTEAELVEWGRDGENWFTGLN